MVGLLVVGAVGSLVGNSVGAAVGRSVVGETVGALVMFCGVERDSALLAPGLDMTTAALMPPEMAAIAAIARSTRQGLLSFRLSANGASRNSSCSRPSL